MKDETVWKIIKRKGRTGLVCRYRIGGTKRWREESTGESKRREAERAAARIVKRAESETRDEIYGWAAFKDRYEAEHLSGLAPKTQQAFRTAANRLIELCPIDSINELDTQCLVRFAAKLREEGRSEATIQAYRDHLRMALRWAVAVELISTMPAAPRLKRVARGTKSRGRQLAREEAERIVMQLPAIVGAEAAKRWAWNLEGLWRSGMRIGETFAFSWEPQGGCHYVTEIDGSRPKITILAESEKGFANRTIPMAPDFAAMLRAVPVNRRSGMVFKWPGMKGGEVVAKTVEKRIAAAGKAAGVVVSESSDGSRNYATAHDFRRSFGARWANKVMPIVLQQLMRHESIETTMKYYVGQNADRTADTLWKVDEGVLGDMLDSLFSSETAYERTVKQK
jgi:integrase